MNFRKMAYCGIKLLIAFGLIGCQSKVPPHQFFTTDLKGIVIDKETRLPIEGVLVTASFGSGRTMGERSEVQGVVVTNGKGEYFIPYKHMESIPNYGYLRRTVSISVTAIGYCGFGRTTYPTAELMLFELKAEGCHVITPENYADKKTVMEKRETLTNKRGVTIITR